MATLDPRNRSTHCRRDVATAEASRVAATRVTLWRNQQRTQRREEAKQQQPPWWKQREKEKASLRLELWRDEAIEKAAPPRTLISSGGGSSTPVWKRSQRAELLLTDKLAEFSQLVARLQRFALLSEEITVKSSGGNGMLGSAAGVDSRVTTMLRESTSLDESRSLLADLLCALRAAITSVVEAVQACSQEQSSDAHLTLNLPAMRKAFTPMEEGDAANQGFASFSSARHRTILVGLTQKVTHAIQVGRMWHIAPTQPLLSRVLPPCSCASVARTEDPQLVALPRQTP